MLARTAVNISEAFYMSCLDGHADGAKSRARDAVCGSPWEFARIYHATNDVFEPSDRPRCSDRRSKMLIDARRDHILR